MQSYMMHLMMKGWKLRWFDPNKGNVILTDHVAYMFRCQEGRAIQGFLSVDASWLTQCPINAIVLLKESMPCNTFTNMYWGLHFSEKFDDNKEWSKIFFDEKHELSETTRHQQKFGKVKDAINWQWRECRR